MQTLRGEEVIRDIYGTASFRIGLESVLPIELCRRIWKMNRRDIFKKRIDEMEEKVRQDRYCVYQITCRFGCSHVKTSVGSYDFYPAKRKRKVQRRFTYQDITYHY